MQASDSATKDEERPLPGSIIFLFVIVVPIVLSIALILIRASTGAYMTTDSHDYINLADFMRGVLTGEDVSAYEFVSVQDPGETTIAIFRLFRPLVPFLASILSLVMPTVLSFLVLNVLFLTLASINIYSSARIMKRSSLEATLGSILFTCSFYVLSWGMSVLVEAASWFFISLGVFIGLHILHSQDEPSIPNEAILGLVLGLGFIVAEHNITVLLFVVWALIQKHRHNPKVLLQKLIVFCAFALLPLLLVHLSVFVLFQYSYAMYLAKYLPSQIIGRSELARLSLEDSILNFLQSYWIAFGPCLIISFLGGLSVSGKQSRVLLIFLVLTLLPNIMLSQTIMYSRFAAHSFPFVVLLSPIKIVELGKRVPVRLSGLELTPFAIVALCIGYAFIAKYLSHSPLVLAIDRAILLLFSAWAVLQAIQWKTKRTSDTMSMSPG